MKTLKFKSNIKCTGCIEKVSPALNELVGKGNWEVNLQSPERILTVSTDSIESEKIIAAIQSTGYTIEETMD